MTTSNSASITAPIYATINDLTGEESGMQVSAFVYNTAVGSISPVYNTTGYRYYATAVIAAGTITCAGLGL